MDSNVLKFYVSLAYNYDVSKDRRVIFLEHFILKMRKLRYFETSVVIYRTTPSNIPQDLTFNTYEDHKPRTLLRVIGVVFHRLHVMSPGSARELCTP
jgi:hypothetical protein